MHFKTVITICTRQSFVATKLPKLLSVIHYKNCQQILFWPLVGLAFTPEAPVPMVISICGLWTAGPLGPLGQLPQALWPRTPSLGNRIVDLMVRQRSPLIGSYFYKPQDILAYICTHVCALHNQSINTSFQLSHMAQPPLSHPDSIVITHDGILLWWLA